MQRGRKPQPMFATNVEDTKVSPVSLETTALSDGAFGIAEAAAFCSLSKRAIQYAIKRGELEVFYYGSKPLIAKRNVIAWLAAMLQATREKQ